MSGSTGTSSTVQGKIAAYAPIGPTTPDTAIHVVRTPDTSVNTYQGSGSDLASEATARQDADTNEANARKAADAQLQTGINNEATQRAYEMTARVAADSQLQTAIDNEANARYNGDNTLYNNIQDERNTRAAADNSLQSQINTINSRLAAAGIP